MSGSALTHWTDLPVVKMESVDGGPIITHVQVPFPVDVTTYDTASLHARAKAMRHSGQMPPSAFVPVAELVATQYTVSSTGLEKYAGGDDDPPVVVMSQQGMHIADGHHRATAAWLRGEKIIEVAALDAPRRANPSQQRIAKRLARGGR